MIKPSKQILLLIGMPLAKQARNVVNSLLENAHSNYCSKLFEDSGTCKSGFGHSYIKNRKNDHFGVAPLNDGGTTYTEAKQKAQILNKQFESVFTNEDVTNFPNWILLVTLK